MTPEDNETYDARICQRVREIRLLRGLTQTEVADQIGIAPEVYARYEKNRRARGWRVSMLADVADVLGVPLSVLVPGERVVCDGCGAARGPLGNARLSAPGH